MFLLCFSFGYVTDGLHIISKNCASYLSAYFIHVPWPLSVPFPLMICILKGGFIYPLVHSLVIGDHNCILPIGTEGSYNLKCTVFYLC